MTTFLFFGVNKKHETFKEIELYIDDCKITIIGSHTDVLTTNEKGSNWKESFELIKVHSASWCILPKLFQN